MTLRSRFLLTLMILFSFSVLAVPNASAKRGGELAKVLGDMEWGDSKDEVLKKMRSQLMDEARKDPKIKRDPLLLQKARKQALDRHKKAEKSYTRLSGDDTGYEVSVISDEFSSDNGESFIRVKDEVAQRFYFFVDNKFYKLVVAYNGSYLRDTDFETFVAMSARKYGRPTAAEYDDIRGEEQLALVNWQTPETALAVKNKKELFDTYTMVFSDRQTLKRLAAQNRAVGGSDKDEEEVSAQVKDLMSGSETDSNATVVDNLTGGSTKINFDEGRPKDDKLKRYDDDGNIIEAEEDTAQAKAKPKKKAKKKTKKRKKKNAPDFSKIEAKGSDDLIIY